MQEKFARQRKQAVNVSIDRELLAAARAAGTNLSAILERALAAELKARREEAWRAENRTAIEASNLELERNGLWCDHYRVW